MSKAWKDCLKTLGVVSSIVIACALVAMYCTGCKAFYENSGSSSEVGEILAPVKITEPTSSFDLELLFSMTGARVWTARDSRVTTKYRNTYTNTYLFGMVDRNGVQDFEVEVEPLATDSPASTNILEIVQ